MQSKDLIGKLVRMVSLDKYGYLGRDLHPNETDVGTFVGTVISFYEEEPEVLLVRNNNGKELELIVDEIQPLP